MPCEYFELSDGTWGVLCSGDIKSVTVDGKTYDYEIPYGCGLMTLNQDGSQRLSPWPKKVWDAVNAQEANCDNQQQG